MQDVPSDVVGEGRVQVRVYVRFVTTCFGSNNNNNNNNWLQHPFNISTRVPIRVLEGLLMSTKGPTNEEQKAAKC